ncbi:hypothetical protein [Natronosalvus caseinilyticus]|uniref:hypothetical protein n=1 Tax=Natronosalvus caseinilyticus TaxID=2953747 RepID=UPI0028B207D5|nr:hypothetical protein [Natronosalvus caseinilyticus]
MSDERPEPEYLEDQPLDDNPEIHWPEDRSGEPPEDARFVGISNPGTPVLYSRESGTLFQGDVTDDGRVTPRAGSDAEMKVESTDRLGEAIRSFGDRIGWESLSQFGKEHWESEKSSR